MSLILLACTPIPVVILLVVIVAAVLGRGSAERPRALRGASIAVGGVLVIGMLLLLFRKVLGTPPIFERLSTSALATFGMILLINGAMSAVVLVPPWAIWVVRRSAARRPGSHRSKR